MSKLTYYIVQLAPDKYAGYGGPTKRVSDAKYIDDLSEARHLFKVACRFAGADTPSRFPRIIKTTIETKTIITRR